MNPLVSIITPVYNRASVVVLTLQSIKNQTFIDFECILIDDGSDEQDLEIIRKSISDDSRFILKNRPKTKPKGANACRNYGLELSRGEYIIFFDSDDFMDLKCLENRISFFKDYSSYDILIFSMGHFKNINDCYLDVERKVINMSLEKTIEEFILTPKFPWNICRPIFKSQLIKNKIFFNEKMHFSQDNEFNIRVLALLRPKYISLDYTDSYYRLDENYIGKYNTFFAKQNILNSYYELTKTIFNSLTEQQIDENKNKLISLFLDSIVGLVFPKIKLNKIFRTLIIYKERMNLTLLNFIFIYLLILINKYRKDKRGSFRLSKILKKLIKNNIS